MSVPPCCPHHLLPLRSSLFPVLHSAPFVEQSFQSFASPFVHYAEEAFLSFSHSTSHMEPHSLRIVQIGTPPAFLKCKT